MLQYLWKKYFGEQEAFNDVDHGLTGSNTIFTICLNIQNQCMITKSEAFAQKGKALVSWISIRLGRVETNEGNVEVC